MGFILILAAVWLLAALLAGGLCAVAARGDRILKAQLAEARLDGGQPSIRLVA